MTSTTILIANPSDWPSSNGTGGDHPCSESQRPHVPSGASFETLGVLADVLDDIENLRIRTGNRLKALTADPDENVGDKGGTFGKGLPEWLPEVKLVQQQLEEIEASEKAAVKRLEGAMKAHPLGPWQAATKGVGAKTLARLLGAIGDPADRDMVSQLWAYCGLHVIGGAAPRRKKGEQSNWSTKAKMRVYLIAKACLMTKSEPFYGVYLKAKAKYADSVHATDCSGGYTSAGQKVVFSKCKVTDPTTGEVRYAGVGDPLAPSHAHARAMRIVCKEILKALWIESRRLEREAA